MEICFKPGAWSTEELTYAYSHRFAETPDFYQEDDCIRNRVNESFRQGFDNVALVTKAPLSPGARITTRCAFEHYGAPLILLAEQLDTDAQGNFRFGNYLEIVLYEDGINVWQMWHQQGKVSWKKLMSVEFPVTAGEIHTLSVTTEADRLHIAADGQKMSLYVPQLYSRFHGGICACEGVDRFYDLTIV